MKWALVAMMAMLTGCASSGKLQTVPTAGANTDAIVHLMGRFSAGQACVVGPNTAISAAHVSDKRPFDGDVPLYPLMWSDGYGIEGVVTPLYVERARDLVILHSTTTFPGYALPGKAPAVGDNLTLVGYDWRSTGKAYARRVLDAKVLRLVGTHLILETKAEIGSSGSCVLDAQGYVVGIMIGGTEVVGGTVGVAVGVYQPWFPKIKQEEKLNEE